VKIKYRGRIDVRRISTPTIMIPTLNAPASPKIPIKYPKDINRKSNPASLWVRLRSASIVGINGEKMIRAVKLIKKIKTNNINNGN
jgi:hypothetical protein